MASVICNCKDKKVYAIKRRKKFKQDTQLIQINMTLVLDIHRMSVEIEQAIFTVSIMDNMQTTKQQNKKNYIIPQGTEMLLSMVRHC